MEAISKKTIEIKDADVIYQVLIADFTDENSETEREFLLQSSAALHYFIENLKRPLLAIRAIESTKRIRQITTRENHCSSNLSKTWDVQKIWGAFYSSFNHFECYVFESGDGTKVCEPGAIGIDPEELRDYRLIWTNPIIEKSIAATQT